MKAQSNQISFVEGRPTLAGRLLQNNDVLLARIGPDDWRRVTIGPTQYKHYDFWMLRDVKTGWGVSFAVGTPARLVGKKHDRKAASDD